MNKIKNFGQFLNENKAKNNIEKENINENIWLDYIKNLNEIPDLFTKIIWSLGLVMEVFLVSGFIAGIAWLIGKGTWEFIKDTELGIRVQEMVNKLKNIHKISKNKNINKEKIAEEIKSTLTEYDDVIKEFESGDLGEKASQAAKILKDLKNNADKL